MRGYATGPADPTIPRMSRYVFSYSDAQDDKVLMAAKKVARAHGATVVKALAGTMLLELAREQLPAVARALPGWHYAAERKTTRTPERTQLERSKAQGVVAASAKR